MTYKEIYKRELAIMFEEFDKRDKYYHEIEEFKFKHGKIPAEHLEAWTAYVSDGKRPWRQVPGVKKKLIKSARKIATREMTLNRHFGEERTQAREYAAMQCVNKEITPELIKEIKESERYKSLI
jgi:hypothetical protein